MLLNIGQIFSCANQAVLKGLGLKRSTAEGLFEKALFAQGPALPKSSKSLSGLSVGATFMVSDYTSLYRAGQDLAIGIWDRFPHSPLNFLKDFLSSKDVALGYHAFGSASSLNVVIGLAQLKKAWDLSAFAKAIGDQEGLLLGRISILKGMTLFGAGASFAVFRPLSMYKIANDLPLSSLVGRLTYGSVQMGLGFYAVFFTILTAILGLQIHEGATFIRGIDRAKELTSQIEWLQKTLRVQPHEVHQRLIDEHGKEKAQELLIEEAISAGKDGIRSMMKEMGIPRATEAKLEEIVKDAIRKSSSGWTREAVERNMNERLMLVGLSMRVQKTQLKQSAKLQRILNRAGFQALQEVASLKGRVSKTDAKAEELVNKIRASAVSKIAENALVGTICALGIVAMIAAMIFTGGIPLILSSAVMLVFSILMAGVDGYGLYMSYKEENPEPHDKKMLVLSTMIGLASFLALIALGATGLVSLGPFPIIVAAILCTLWIGQNGATMMIINRNEKLHQFRNPTLETFLKALQDDREKEKIMKMFSNLPEKLKRQIQEAMKNHQNDMKRAALSVAKKVEEAKAKRLELLRQALTPYLVTESAS